MRVKKISEISPVNQSENPIRDAVNCIVSDREYLLTSLSEPTLLKATTVVLVLSGTAVVSVNHTVYNLERGYILLLSASHLFFFTDSSADFTAVSLFLSRDFADNMDTTAMINQRIRHEVKIFHRPAVPIGHASVDLLARRMRNINEALDGTDHLYHKEMVLNMLFAFFLDLSNIIDRLDSYFEDGAITRQEVLMSNFIELLMKHYKKEHNVEFYASALNVSTRYLSLVAKRVTGQSVTDFIFEMLFSEARNLLKTSDLSVQEVALQLNFSDQSAFGKFFKRKAGVSPSLYLKK